MLRQYQQEIEELRKKLAEQDDDDDDESEEEVMGEDGQMIRRKSRNLKLILPSSLHAYVFMTLFLFVEKRGRAKHSSSSRMADLQKKIDEERKQLEEGRDMVEEEKNRVKEDLLKKEYELKNAQ